MLSTVSLYMYVLSKISHTFEPNQVPSASSVDYFISQMSQPFFKFCPRVLVLKLPKIFVWNSSLELISHHLPRNRPSTYKLKNSFPLRCVNKIMTESTRPLWEMMLLKWDLNKVWLITLTLKMSISGLLYASCLVLLMNRNNIENYLP